MISSLPLLDLIAILWFFLCWIGYHFYTKKNHKCNLQKIANHWRKQWALSLLKRDVRIMDSQIINGLMQKDTFFASTTILILASSIAILGFKDKVHSILDDIPFFDSLSNGIWEFKVLILASIFVYAFFKFSWSIRQHSFCAILLGSIPDKKEADSDNANDLAIRLAHVTNKASKNFNDGLRAYYFALALLSWLLNPIFFILVTSWVIGVLYRREFHSHTLELLTIDKNSNNF